MSNSARHAIEPAATHEGAAPDEIRLLASPASLTFNKDKQPPQLQIEAADRNWSIELDPSPEETPTDTVGMKLLAAAKKYNCLGLTVVPLRTQGVPLRGWKHWFSNPAPQSSQYLNIFDWETVRALSLVAGCNRLIGIDLDTSDEETKARIRAGLSIPDNYAWRIETGGGEGHELLLLSCDTAPSEDEPDVYWFDLADGKEHIEVMGRHLVTVPPSEHRDEPHELYRFLNSDGIPDDPMMILKLSDVLAVLAKHATLRRPTYREDKPEDSEIARASNANDAVAEALRLFPVRKYCETKWPGQIQDEGNGNFRIKGNGGLIIHDDGYFKQFGTGDGQGKGVLHIITLALFGHLEFRNLKGPEQQRVFVELQQWSGVDPSEVQGDRLVCANASIGQQEALSTHPGVEPVRGFHPSDTGNAERFVSQYRDILKYNADAGKWLLYDQTRWLEDRKNDIQTLALKTIRSLYAEAAAIEGEAERKRVIGYALSLESATKQRNMLQIARALPGVAVVYDELDRNPYLLNLINGTYDLNTNTLMQHRAGDLLTKRAEVVYDPAATCPRWMAFLDRVQHGNQEMIAFLQRAAGLSLSGIVPEQVFFFLHGKGANGKTTLIEVLHAIYCGYAVAAPEEMLLTRQKNRGTASPELTRLRSARFVSAIELPEGGRLDESLIKQLTGGDTISARNLYEQFFEFKPTHKLWIAGNHRPIITGTDDAIWRRPLLIPFPVKIPESEQRRNMQEYLLEESSGILNWLLAGWRQYRDMGLGVPECVRAATAEYRSEQDLLGDFLDECCDKGEGLTVTHADLMFDYKLWAERQGIEPLGGRRISESLAERGFVRMRRHAGTRGWKGLALQVSDPRSSG